MKDEEFNPPKVMPMEQLAGNPVFVKWLGRITAGLLLWDIDNPDTLCVGVRIAGKALLDEFLSTPNLDKSAASMLGAAMIERYQEKKP